MPFPRKLLNEGEDVILDLHPHWWFFTKPALATAASTALLILLSRIEVDYVWLVGGVLLVLSLLWLLVRYLKWSTTNFVLTTDRLIDRSGVLSKHGHEIPLERVNDIAVSQTLFERIIGAGDVMI